MSQGTFQECFSQLDRFEKAQQSGRYVGQFIGVTFSAITSWKAATQGATSIALKQGSKEVVKKISCETGAISARVTKEGIVCLDKLSKAGQIMDRSGLTKAGRALDKHGGRPNSIFPKSTGNPVNKNMEGQFHLDDILTHPQSTSYPNRFGGQDIFSPDGRGVRFDAENKLTGFLQPRRIK